MGTIHPNCLNEVMSAKMSSTKPFVGMAATMFVGSDRYAMVVTDIISNKKIRVSHMFNEDYNRLDENETLQCINTNDMGKYMALTEDQTHMVPMGVVYSLRKNHRWIQEGQGLWSTGSIHLGHADNYRDPCF